MNGAMSMRGWTEVRGLWPYSLVALALALCFARRLNVLVLGDDAAGSMGMNVQANRVFFTALAAVLAASAVSAVGLLGFVGLIVPHLVRMVLGPDHRLTVPGSILAGAALLVASDTLSRTVFSPIEIPVGITMTALGVPFFLFLLRRSCTASTSTWRRGSSTGSPGRTAAARRRWCAPCAAPPPHGAGCCSTASRSPR